MNELYRVGPDSCNGHIVTHATYRLRTLKKIYFCEGGQSAFWVRLSWDDGARMSWNDAQGRFAV
jgi:hypothetical protein